jgi:putative photosynthetic complex assembly protein 2
MLATIYNDLLGLAALLWCAWLVRSAANKSGVWALAAFWGAHQLAKISLFMGVAYPGADFLPSYLTYLAGYFGGPSNSPILYLTIAGLALLGAFLAVRTRREARDGRRMLLGLLTTLVLLMLVEHLWLGMGSGSALWTLFLSARSS